MSKYLLSVSPRINGLCHKFLEHKSWSDRISYFTSPFLESSTKSSDSLEITFWIFFFFFFLLLLLLGLFFIFFSLPLVPLCTSIDY